jgi:protocatechuate 3,4-dioxygenase beta subunit
VRQEFILLSDTLGVSMLVDAINHRHSASATETTVFGPFYIEGMPERAFGENMAFTAGETALVRGRVVDTHGEPLAGAVLDVWQTAENGMYSGQDTEQPFGNLRGRYRTDANGYFAIRTIVPVCYPIPTDGPVGRMLNAANRCPHFSVPLDYRPQEFCTYRGKILMCAHHSAMFRFEDGHCIDGPCKGAQLEPVPVRWVEDQLVMEV